MLKHHFSGVSCLILIILDSQRDLEIKKFINNKLKSLKVAQVKDEMDDDEDDGSDGVCDVAW